MSSRTAVVIGASSGIGRALCQELSREGWRLAVTARREPMLVELAAELPGECVVRVMDVAHPASAALALEELFGTLKTVDLVVINAGVAGLNKTLDYALDEPILHTNVEGFSALALAAMRFFMAQGHGHLVGVSSIAGIRGLAATPAYGASKAYVSNYLEALRAKAKKTGKPIFVTDIRPGYVDTPMTEGQKNMFWVASPQKAARQMLSAIHRRKRIAYITRRWWLMGVLLRHLPAGLYEKSQ